MNEQFINDLSKELAKLGTIHSVGEEWISYTGKIPSGGIPYCGQEITRETYSALWSWAQAQGLVKTESEWQSWASSHGGNVPYYSSGNGSTTFRMPRLVGYVRGASGQSESGSYIAEGLPDHTHKAPYDFNDTLNSHVASANANAPHPAADVLYTTIRGYGKDSTKASESNPIYGNSNHVTPETSVVMFGVYAFGTVVNVGELDARALLDELNTKLPLSGGTMTGAIALRKGDNSLVAPSDDSYIEIEGGTKYGNGASLCLYGKDSSNTPGHFKLFANAGSGKVMFAGSPDGSLTWGGKNVVRSVNGTAADASGNVTVTVNTANKATATPNVVLALKNEVKLPSGGTWKYVTPSIADGNWKSGTVSGGSKISVSYSANTAIIAIRTA